MDNSHYTFVFPIVFEFGIRDCFFTLGCLAAAFLLAPLFARVGLGGASGSI